MGEFCFPLQGSRTLRQKGDIASVGLQDLTPRRRVISSRSYWRNCSLRFVSFSNVRDWIDHWTKARKICSSRSVQGSRISNDLNLWFVWLQATCMYVCIYINTRRKKERKNEWTEKHLFSRWSRQRIISLNLFDDIPQFQWFANLQRRHAKHLFTFEFVQLIAVDLMFGENDRRVLVALLMEKCNQIVGCPIVNIRNITT